jgi:hypothetical protein
MQLREAVEKELKAIVVTALRASGFKGSFPHFRRPLPERIDLLTFQFDRHGGGFVLEASQCPPEGVTTYWGKAIAPSKVTAHDLHPDSRIRVQRTPGSGTDSWFRYDQGQVQECALQVLPHLSSLERWWALRART